MRKHHLLALICLPALAAACSSRNMAPVVYGSEPSWQGRVYTAPDQTAPNRTASARNGQRQAAYQRAERRVAADRSHYAGARPQLAASAPVDVQALDRLEPVSRGRAGRAEDAYLETALAGGALNKATAGMVRVKKGDTVYAIARRTGTSPGAIITLNGMRPPYPLSVGQVVRVPRNDVAIAEAPIEAAPRRRKVASAPSPSAGTASKRAPSPAASTARRSDGGVHIIRPGDTLYQVSRAAGVSIEALAAANNLRQPYQLSVGDRLVIPKRPVLASVRPASAGQSMTIASIADERPAARTGRLFDWPLKGALVRRFETGVGGSRNDGINIAAPVGTPVRAAADGEVVYRGSDLEGYGNLILIRHDGDFVTAYAHNDVMLVRKGQKVRQGQIISKVGQSGSASQPQLHFEIRRDLKAIDPLTYLQS